MHPSEETARPQFSIITVCRNSLATLPHCVDSVAIQSPSLEHIIIDGASSDGTREWLERKSPPLRFLSEPDDGIYSAMNKGLELARGEIVGLLNADDFYPDSRVLEWVGKQFENESLDAVYGDLLVVDAGNSEKITRYWRSGTYSPSSFRLGWMPPHPTFFVRRSCYREFGLFNTALGSAADYELMLRFLLRNGLRASYLPHVLVHMRAGGISNRSLLNRLRANANDRRAWRVNHLTPAPWTMLLKPLRKISQWWQRLPST